jgi:hypothetical protein
MAEPVTTTAAGLTLASTAAALPPLAILGISLGLRPDILVAGFFGSIVAIILLNSVPAEGDTWSHMVRSTVKRLFVAAASSVTAGYLAPLAPLVITILPDALLLGVSFVIGGGAQQILARAILRAEKLVDRGEPQ